MKIHKCDSCGACMENPHEVRMKEFIIVADYTEYGVFPLKQKQKVKIHLCAKCFYGLSHIAEKALEDKKRKEDTGK